MAAARRYLSFMVLALDTFARRLQWAREQRKISQRRLGLECGTSHALVGMIEREESGFPAVDVAARLAKRLGCPLDWLVNGTGPRPRIEAEPEKKRTSHKAA